MMNCEEIKMIELLLSQCETQMENKNFEAILPILDEGITAIGNQYFSENILDSTGMKLVLSDAEKDKGNFERAAHLKRNVLTARVELFKKKFNCL